MQKINLPKQLFEKDPTLDVEYNGSYGYGYTYKDKIKFVLWVSNHVSIKFVLTDKMKEAMNFDEQRTYFRYIILVEEGTKIATNEIKKLEELCEYLYKKF